MTKTYTNTIESHYTDLAKTNSGKNVPAHNVYNNLIKPSQFKTRLINTVNSDINLFNAALYEVLEDCKADLANQALTQSDTKSHYRKYLNEAKSVLASLPAQAKTNLTNFIQQLTSLV